MSQVEASIALAPGEGGPTAAVVSTTAGSAIDARGLRQRLWLAAIFGPALLLPLWLVPYLAWGWQMPVTFSAALLAVMVCVVSVTDVRQRRIPNWATYSAFFWGIALNAYHSWGAPEQTADVLGTVGLSASLWGAGILFVAALVLFSLTGGGAGDVKMLTALGALLGLGLALDAVLYGFVFAGAGCLIWALWQHGPLTTIVSLARMVGCVLLPLWIDRPNAEQRGLLRLPVPLAPFFAAGTLLVLCGLSIERWALWFGR